MVEESGRARRALRKKLWTFRIALVVIFAVTTSAVAFLAWTRVPSTEVGLDLAVSEVLIGLAETWDLYGVEAQSVKVSHLDAFMLRGVRQGQVAAGSPEESPAKGWHPLEAGRALRIGPVAEYWSAWFQSDYLTGTLRVESGAVVRIARGASERPEVRIEVVSGSATGTIDVAEHFLLACNGCSIEGLEPRLNRNPSKILKVTTAAREIEFTDRNGRLLVGLDLRKQSDQDYVLAKGLRVASVDFSRDEGATRESTVVQEGAIYFPELDGKRFLIRPGDFISLELDRPFQLRRLSLGKHITLTLHGRVRQIRSGTPDFMYSRLPSYLEWFYTNQPFRLFAGALVAAMSTILAVLYRLKVLEREE